MKAMKTFAAVSLLAFGLAAAGAAQATDRGDRIEQRWDARGDRIDRALDRRAACAAAHGRYGLAERLDRRGDRIDARFDRIGARREARFDRRH
jgi:hypothetical protein